MAHVLAKKFTRKGETTANNSRMWVTYTQLMGDNFGTYLYKVDYDGAIHYTAFICDYYEHNLEFFEMYPDEKSYATGRALNFRDYNEAVEAYRELQKTNNVLAQ